MVLHRESVATSVNADTTSVNADTTSDVATSTNYY